MESSLMFYQASFTQLPLTYHAQWVSFPPTDLDSSTSNAFSLPSICIKILSFLQNPTILTKAIPDHQYFTIPQLAMTCYLFLL